MTDYYEMPHRKADECPHAGVGKACRPCRDRFEESATREDLTGVINDAAFEGVEYDRAERVAAHLLARFNITPRADR